MTLITPSNLRFILNISILSRVIVIIIQFLSNILIEDHNADAYRNRYYLSLTKNNDKNTSSSAALIPGPYVQIYKSIQGLTKWDAQYFLEISKDGYTSEKHLAFLPIYPIAISLLRRIIFDHKGLNFKDLIPSSSRYILQRVDNEATVEELEIFIQSSLIGTILNNFLLFPIACLSLFLLTKLVKSSDETYARTVVWWFCFNPASIFFSACYSESFYAALTFTALFIIELRVSKYLTNYPLRRDFQPLFHLNRLIYTVLPALALLAIATAVRSNGLINIGFIAYQFLLKYMPILYADRSHWTFVAHLCSALDLIQDLLVLVISSVIAAAGYISFQIYSYVKFCVQTTTNNREKGSMMQRPEWCNKQLAHPYGHVQEKYWNVGLFKYYELKQLPNFLLAAPVTYIVLKGSLNGAKDLVKSPRGKKQLAYYMQAIMLTLLCSVSINIQVVTRLIASSCPAFYWIVTDMTRGSRMRTRIFQAYFSLYFFLGTILHVNFLPWT